jgi:nicotinamidase-related amidase
MTETTPSVPSSDERVLRLAETHAAGRLIAAEDCALLLIDVQDEWADLVPGSERFVFEVERMAKFARLAGIPIVWAEQAGLGTTAESVRAVLGEQEPIGKSIFSCFCTTGLAEGIAATRRRTLLVTGAEAHICVMQTVIDALAAGYTVHVVADAVASRSQADRLVGIERMRTAGAVITSVEMAMFELMRRSDSDLFSAVLLECAPWTDS